MEALVTLALFAVVESRLVALVLIEPPERGYNDVAPLLWRLQEQVVVHQQTTDVQQVLRQTHSILRRHLLHLQEGRGGGLVNRKRGRDLSLRKGAELVSLESHNFKKDTVFNTQCISL